MNTIETTNSAIWRSTMKREALAKDAIVRAYVVWLYYLVTSLSCVYCSPPKARIYSIDVKSNREKKMMLSP